MDLCSVSGAPSQLLRRLAPPQIVVDAVIACYPPRQLVMCVGAASGIDLRYVRRIDGEFNDQPIG